METAIGIGIGLIAGAFLSFLFALLVVRLQRERKVLGYAVIDAKPIITAEFSEGDPLRIMLVRDSLGQGLDPNQYRTVKRVYSFKVELRNQGTVDIVGGQVLLRLSPGSTIAKVSVQPPGQAINRSFEAVTKLPHILELTIDTLKKNELLTVELLSVENPDPKCEVLCEQPQTDCMDMDRARRIESLIRSVVGTGFMLLAMAIFLATAPPSKDERPFLSIRQIVALGLSMLGYVIMFWGMFHGRSSLRGLLKVLFPWSRL